MLHKLKFIVFILYVGCTPSLTAQTCCSAGAPLISSFGLNVSGETKFSLAIGYNYRSINRLVDQNTIIENDPRNRNFSSILFKAHYSISQAFSVGVAIPTIFHKRQTFSEIQTTSGIGDPILTAQYNILQNQKIGLIYSSTIKIPIGNSNHKDSRGIVVSPDMQSGSGTFDFINRLGIQFYNVYNTGISAQLGFHYRYNGENKNFASSSNFGGRAFQFGNEYQWSTNISKNLLFDSWFVTPNLEIKYRVSRPNSEQNTEAPNSGGQWLSSTIGLYILPKDKISYRLYYELPIYQNLKGLQISTSYDIGVELKYRFAKSSEKIKDIKFQK